MIKTAGANVAAAEVEAELLCHPAVGGAHVVPAPAAARGEDVAAFVVAARPVKPAELIEHCGAELASYKVPRARKDRGIVKKGSGGGRLARKASGGGLSIKQTRPHHSSSGAHPRAAGETPASTRVTGAANGRLPPVAIDRRTR